MSVEDKNPRAITPRWKRHYRIIPSRYPPVDFFEDMVAPHLMEALFHLEGLTNDRLLEEVGDIHLVAAEDRVSGPGSSVLMAAFTHIDRERDSRFTDGTFGVYYAGNSLGVAIVETRYHREIFMRNTNQDPGTLHMRCYVGNIEKPLLNIKPIQYESLYDPVDYSQSQLFGKKMRSLKPVPWGLVYRSVRYEKKGECVALFRPPATSTPRQGKHLAYEWDGEKIAHIYELKEIVIKPS